ncbi:LysR family transcriptional regulator [uncultured Pseudoteredinibacter sp.]|uniref:LysR family transcriptional regulator n=1 Tax=uncultured Pseudoteredinibacter sp. TaxID=1641701 RepID=UPI0026194C8D|nr:LysR family transcriptional regulator [uncultured Pseudoteredinibacter sp.]
MADFINGITYTQLLSFRAIFEAGNISKAAKKLGVSAASVSHSLKSLEKQLSAPLFLRTTRTIRATELGVRLYDGSCAAMDQLNTTVEQACENQCAPSGRLSLNMAKNIYDVYLKDILREFQANYPSIQLDINLSDSLDQHIDNNFDIGFRFDNTVNENMVVKPLAERLKKTKIALAAAPKYIEQNGRLESIDQLSKHQFIKFRIPSSQKLFPIRLRENDNPSSTILSFDDLPTAAIVNNTDVLIDMALEGVGIVVLIDAMLMENFRSGELLPLLETHWCETNPIYMYFAPENRHLGRVRCFLDFVDLKLSP